MPPKKDSKEEKKKDHFVEVMFVLLVFGILILLWSYILRTIFNGSSYLSIWNAIVAWFLHYLWPIIIVLAVIASIAAIFGIIYNLRKIHELALAEKKIHGRPKEDKLETVAPIVARSERWERVEIHASSENPSDWRQAIIEADIMLEEALRAKGYHGDTLGELLKSVDKSDLRTLDSAWEAHKVRNQIAHSGSEFQLNERDTTRVVALFQSVFRELGLIP